jgi:hypothetical protein
LYCTDISLTVGYVVVLINPKKLVVVVDGRIGLAAAGLPGVQDVPFQYSYFVLSRMSASATRDR